MNPNGAVIWVLIAVRRGLIEPPRFFHSKRLALAAMERMRKAMNPDYDEVDVFKKRISGE